MYLWRPLVVVAAGNGVMWKPVAGVVAIDLGGWPRRGRGEVGYVLDCALVTNKPLLCASSPQLLIRPAGGLSSAICSQPSAFWARVQHLLLWTGTWPARQQMESPSAWDHGSSGGARRLPAPSLDGGLRRARLTVWTAGGWANRWPAGGSVERGGGGTLATARSRWRPAAQRPRLMTRWAGLALGFGGPGRRCVEEQAMVGGSAISNSTVQKESAKNYVYTFVLILYLPVGLKTWYWQTADEMCSHEGVPLGFHTSCFTCPLHFSHPSMILAMVNRGYSVVQSQNATFAPPSDLVRGTSDG